MRLRLGKERKVADLVNVLVVLLRMVCMETRGEAERQGRKKLQLFS